MSVSIPKELHFKLHRWLVFAIATYVMYRLDIKDYRIAGSYRRGKRWCNDIDILVPERYFNPVLDDKLKVLGWRLNPLRNHSLTYSRQYGKSLKKWRKLIMMDLMPFSNKNTGNTLLYATGPARLNDIIRARLKTMGYTWRNPRFFEKLDDGTRVKFISEKDAAEFVGIEYLEPNRR